MMASAGQLEGCSQPPIQLRRAGQVGGLDPSDRQTCLTQALLDAHPVERKRMEMIDDHRHGIQLGKPEVEGAHLQPHG